MMASVVLERLPLLISTKVFCRPAQDVSSILSRPQLSSVFYDGNVNVPPFLMKKRKGPC